jgi:NAD(P)-dependent dehydrogenase (short-subunit alcohol dehydrogenase family)
MTERRVAVVTGGGSGMGRAIDTPMLRGSEQRGMLGGTVDDHAKRVPVRRAGLPEDIAAACSFLVSDEAGYVTGQVIGVNGGLVT